MTDSNTANNTLCDVTTEQATAINYGSKPGMGFYENKQAKRKSLHHTHVQRCVK